MTTTPSFHLQSYDNHVPHFLAQFRDSLESLDMGIIDFQIGLLADARQERRRVFVAGNGGSACSASHFALDLQKLCNINAVCLTDNVGMVTAIANDHGFENVFALAAQSYQPTPDDVFYVFSVGGGTGLFSSGIECLIETYSTSHFMGVVGKKTGFLKLKYPRSVLHVQCEEGLVTPISEAMQGVVHHAIVSHPLLQVNRTMW